MSLEKYLGSKELKKLIVQRSHALDIPFRYICTDVDLSYKHFMEAYINSIENKEFKVTEEQFEKILENLGIKVRMQLLVQNPGQEYNPDEVREKLKLKYERG
jgi:hypothetical protein